MRDFQAKQRLLTSRPDVALEPAELRELMAAADLALAELTDIRARCIKDEEAARSDYRASSPLLGRRSGGVRRRSMRRAEANQFRSTTSSIDRWMNDLHNLQASLRPTEIDLRDERPPVSSTATATAQHSALPPPPARLAGAGDEPGQRPPTEHEQALFTWLTDTLHEVLTNREQATWPAISAHLLESYGAPRDDLLPSYARLQRHLLSATVALGRIDQHSAIEELTSSYTVLRQQGASVPQP